MEVVWRLEGGLKLALRGKAGRQEGKLHPPFSALTEGPKGSLNHEGVAPEGGDRPQKHTHR